MSCHLVNAQGKVKASPAKVFTLSLAKPDENAEDSSADPVPTAFNLKRVVGGFAKTKGPVRGPRSLLVASR